MFPYTRLRERGREREREREREKENLKRVSMQEKKIMNLMIFTVKFWLKRSLGKKMIMITIKK